MEDNINSKTINRVICFTLLVFSISIIFVVLKYIGIVGLIGKVMKAIIPVIIAIFISFLFDPFIEFFNKKGINRVYSALLCYGAFLLVILGLFYFIIPSLIKQIEVLIQNIPSLLEMVVNFMNSLGIEVKSDTASSFINGVIINVTKGAVTFFNSSFSIIFDFLLGISGALFLSFDFEKFKKWIKRIIPKKIKGPVVFYFREFLPVIRKYFVGMLIDSILVFFISFVSFSLLRLDYILVLSVFVALTNLIPIIGPYIGGIPATIVGFSVSYSLGIIVLVVIFLIQLIESNFLQPYILKNAIKLHPLEGILGISLFGTLFGVTGMILSPILITAIKLLFMPYDSSQILKEEYIDK